MLSFKERGRGPALVFIHAFPLDSAMWDAQAAFFADRYRVITPDVIGFGDSLPAVPWNMAGMVEELSALLDHLGVKTCTLAGLSMGGYIALPFALKHPERVQRLILAHTRARADLEAERANRNSMIEDLKKAGVAGLPDKMLPRLLGPDATEDVKNFVRASIGRTSVEADIHAVEAMRDREDQTGNLSKVHCPTLVLTGSADAILKVEDSEKMAALIPASGLVVIPRTGHLSNLEDPVAFNGAVDAFLRQNDSK